MPNERLLDWFDKIDAILMKEAELAGLFEHNVSKGTAREFMVSRLLKSFLPVSVEIGSGQVVDSMGKISKQMDIVIYDPRFPALRTGAGSLFLVEGVIATIEIKSLLNSTALLQALENCESVNCLIIQGREVQERDQEIGRLQALHNITVEAAERRFHLNNGPATYVFAFDTGMSLETTASEMAIWGSKYGSDRIRMLPRVLTAGQHVVVFDDGFMQMNYDDSISSFGTAFMDKRRFRCLACHLFVRVAERLGLRNAKTNCDYTLVPYINGSDLVPAGTRCFAIQDLPPNLEAGGNS